MTRNMASGAARPMADELRGHRPALKNNQPTQRDAVERYFDGPLTERLEAVTSADKDHDRLEARTCTVSAVDTSLCSKQEFAGPGYSWWLC